MVREKSPGNVKASKEIGHVPKYILFLFMLVTVGCCSESVLERDYGRTWAYNQAVQIANPDAVLVPTPATGLSPTAATTTMDGYNKSFERKKEEKQQGSFINIGGGGGGSSK
jgi:hypothetical protein